ncbi:Chromodomain Y-like protein [Araneus ventricosus]|uniref:Chromodomain Y-like protein n=1 Tax=Araneus ventricosus TaxID=182803 RepID=A0A4Y2CF94_ARAVE|nr:Chromodomain Y-like protein [Araneus ventricosus]
MICTRSQTKFLAKVGGDVFRNRVTNNRNKLKLNRVKTAKQKKKVAKVKLCDTSNENSVIETRDLDSVRSMYEGLLESFISTQINNSSSGNTRVSKKKKPEEETLRISVRQSEGAFRYKEIVVKRHKNYIQVVLVPNGIKQNSLSVEAMKELKDAFVLAKKDPNCHAVLLNSSGSYFCTGVDLSPLVGSNKKQAAEDLASSIRDLVMTLAFFTKPVVAAVNGTAVGFGVSLLTYCDVILASDKATFCLPSAKIGYLPEGGATLTLPQVVGTSAAAELFLQGRRLTADEAKRCGLVSEVLWPTSLMNDVMPRLERIAQQPLQVDYVVTNKMHDIVFSFPNAYFGKELIHAHMRKQK